MFLVVLGAAFMLVAAALVYVARQGREKAWLSFAAAVEMVTAGQLRLQGRPLLPIQAPPKDTACQVQNKNYGKAPSLAASWRSVDTQWPGRSAPGSAKSAGTAVARSHSCGSATSSTQHGCRSGPPDSPCHSSSGSLPTPVRFVCPLLPHAICLYCMRHSHMGARCCTAMQYQYACIRQRCPIAPRCWDRRALVTCVKLPHHHRVCEDESCWQI